MPLAITIDLQLSFADQQQFRVGVAMRWMGHLAGGQRRLMHFNRLARG